MTGNLHELSPAAHERQERLRELTRALLEVLDQLTEFRESTRDVASERDLLTRKLEARQAECVRIEHELAEARRRVRASRAMATTREFARSDELDVVFWIPEPYERAPAPPDVRMARGFGGARLLVCPPAYRPVDSSLDVVSADRPGLSAAVARGMAGTRSSAVLFVPIGTGLDAIEGSFPGVGVDERIAISVPLLLHGPSRATLGLVDTGQLELCRAPVAGGDATPADASRRPIAAPEGFVVHRYAYELLGPWAAGLSAAMTVADYCLAAVARGFLVRPEPELVLTVTPGLDLLERPAAIERERLEVIARHRAEDLGSALGAMTSTWTLDPDELHSSVGEVLAQAPSGHAGSVEFLARQAVGLQQATVARHVLDTRLERADEALRALHDVLDDEDAPQLRALSQRVRDIVADAHRPGDWRAVMDSLRQRVDLEVRAKLELQVILGRLYREAELEVERVLGDARLDSRPEIEARGLTIDRLRQENATLAARVHNLEEQVAAVRTHLQMADEAQRDLIYQREEGRRVMAEGLEADPESSFESLGDRAAELTATLVERHRWILQLLEERQHRTMRLRRRRFAPHEAQFIADVTGTASETGR